MGTGLKGIRALAVVFVLSAPASAFAHAYIVQPPSRDALTQANLDARAKKFGPCGAVPRTNTPKEYSKGATIEVKWQETIAHSGCFQIGFSPANDQNWVLLKQIDDPAGKPADEMYKDTVTLPPGVTCDACTLVVRQLMLENGGGGGCPANADAAAYSTYYSCADIRITESGDSGVSSDAGPIDSGVSTRPSDSGADSGDDDEGTSSSGGRRQLPPSDDGCSVGWGATGGFSLFTSLGLGALALVRRRRRTRK